MAVENTTLALKHHILNGRLAEAKKLIAASQLSLEDVVDEDGNTALHWCAQGLETPVDKRQATDQEMFAFLLQNGAPKNRQNSLGETPLLTALRQALLDPPRAEVLVGAFVKKGRLDPCRADYSGETPLMEAAAAGSVSLGKLLLEARASPLAESSSGLSAAKLAEESGGEDFVKLLKSPLAERAAAEARASEAEGRSEAQDETEQRDLKAKKLDQTLFGQRLHPGLARDKDAPGKPYPEHQTLHDID
mmetsp:Transcript_23406/g.65800  ORF Transcript_23406/g.65800 Transcript_23406/m.65800 type:complete len:248 (-) Transcript_23406:94-837(-)